MRVGGSGNAAANNGPGRNHGSFSNRTPSFSTPRSLNGQAGSPGFNGPNSQSHHDFSNHHPGNTPGVPGQPGTHNGDNHPRTNGGNNLPGTGGGNNNGNQVGNHHNDNDNHQGNNGNYHPSTANHSFYHGYWNNHYGPGGNTAGNNSGPRNGQYNGQFNGSGYGRMNGFGYGQNAYGLNSYGLGGYGANGGYGGYGGYGSSGGMSGLGSLMQVGLALAGYGGGGMGALGGIGSLLSSGLGGQTGYNSYGGYGLVGGYPVGWGPGGGGLGGLAYNSGYLPYTNPYYATSMPGFNYAQPISTAIATVDNPTATQAFDTAVAQFKAGDYTDALVSVDSAIQQNPTDTVMHEFRALDQFAMQDYQGAAATIHSVLAVGPGWDWTTVSSLYPDVAVYEAQLRTLEQTVAANPMQADSRFLLAYHYMSTGYTDNASKLLADVVRLAPTDRLAADLLKMTEVGKVAQSAPTDAAPTADQTAATATPAVPKEPAVAPAPVDPAALVGDWHAERSDGSKFGIHFADDKSFTWKVTSQGQDTNLTGKFGVEKDLLALESQQQGGMIGRVSDVTKDHFTFKLVGAPLDDQGLAFNR